MKKILFFAAIASIALTSCSKSESVNQTQGQAIGFDQSYVGKITKGVPVGGTTFADGSTMAVYSTKDGAVDMNNVTVTKAGGSWTYSPVMYYALDKPYVFTAVAPAGAASVAGDNVTYTVDVDITKQVDFMYTPSEVNRTWNGTDEVAPIQFTFNHALSQVKFSAKAAADLTAMYTVKITDVTIKQVNSAGTLAMKTSAWSALGTPVDYTQSVEDFTLSATMTTLANSKTTTANNVLMLIPQTWASDLEVVVALDVTATGEGDAGVNGPKTFTAKIPAGTWTRNTIYNYQMTLDLATILNLKSVTFGEPSMEVWTAEEVDTPIAGQ